MKFDTKNFYENCREKLNFVNIGDKYWVLQMQAKVRVFAAGDSKQPQKGLSE